MSNEHHNNLLRNLDRARALASEAIEHERLAREKKEELRELLGGPMSGAVQDLNLRHKTVEPLITGLPPGYEHVSKAAKIRKLLEVNAGRVFSTREIANHIGELEHLPTIATTLSRLAKSAGNIKKTRTGRYTYETSISK